MKGLLPQGEQEVGAEGSFRFLTLPPSWFVFFVLFFRSIISDIFGVYLLICMSPNQALWLTGLC